MKTITLLTDYLGHFESKFTAIPYRSGMDISLLKKYFGERDFHINIQGFADIDFRKNSYKNEVFLYTSSEDSGSFYKSYIEDIILGLTLSGAYILPDFKYLRANNNKVFMEILRDLAVKSIFKNISSYHFGVIEELLDRMNKFENISVVKSSAGAMSSGVLLSHNKGDLIKKGKKISKTINLLRELKELVRKVKHKNYIRESRHRKKFVVQNLIPDLTNDWKILIYGRKYFVLNRQNRENDFRASGSGRLSFKKEIPDGILDFAKSVYEELDVPNLSIDVGFANNQFYLFEFQALYFGTYTVVYSPFYFRQINNLWKIIEEKSILEKVYAESICDYLAKKNYYLLNN